MINHMICLSHHQKRIGEQITKKGHRVLRTNFTLEIQNQKVEGLITYSTEQQIFKFIALQDTKTLKTINPDEVTNLEIQGENVDFPSAVKPMYEFDPYDKSYDNFFSPPEVSGELQNSKHQLYTRN